MNYFIFNKESDYQRGVIENCDICENGIKVTQGKVKGEFFSRVLDSCENETVWHRMKLVPSHEQVNYKLYFYASDSAYLNIDGGARGIAEVLKEKESSIEQKKKWCEPHLQKVSSNQEDVLLHEIKGRYFWVLLEIYDYEHNYVGVEDICFYFPKETWMKHLPDVYQKDADSLSFLERFLGVFQSVYDELDYEIANNHYSLEPLTTKKEFLYFLADLVDIDNAYSWEESHLREVVSRSSELYQKRGTKQGLIDIIEIATNEKPIIVEGWQLEGKTELQERFYGTHRNSITVIVNEKHLKEREREVLMNLIQGFTPVGIEINLRDIREYTVLGEHLYLGVNSKLEKYESFKLDGLSRIDSSIIV